MIRSIVFHRTGLPMPADPAVSAMAPFAFAAIGGWGLAGSPFGGG